MEKIICPPRTLPKLLETFLREGGEPSRAYNETNTFNQKNTIQHNKSVQYNKIACYFYSFPALTDLL